MATTSGSAMECGDFDLPDELNLNDPLPSPSSDESERSDCSINTPNEEKLISDLFQDLAPSLHLQEEYELLSSMDPALLQLEDYDQGMQVNNRNNWPNLIPVSEIWVSDGISDIQGNNNVDDSNCVVIGREEGGRIINDAPQNGMDTVLINENNLDTPFTSFQKAHDEFGPSGGFGKSSMSEVLQDSIPSDTCEPRPMAAVSPDMPVLPAPKLCKKSQRASAIKATQVIREVTLNEHKSWKGSRMSNHIMPLQNASKPNKRLIHPKPTCQEADMDSSIDGHGQSTKKRAKMSNAESAKLNRDRHKMYVDGLEQTIGDQNQEIQELKNKLLQREEIIISKDKKILHLQNVLHHDTALARIIGRVVPEAKPVISSSAVNDHCYDAAPSQVPNVAFLGNICLTVKDENNVSVNSCAECAQATMKEEDV